MYAYIFNIQRFSIHDGPGIRTTVFFQGCPLQCVWCHNAEGIPLYYDKGDGTNLQKGVKKYALDDLVEEIMKDRVFYEESGGGVTFSGGEPLMQSVFLISILRRLKELNIDTVVDTSGYAPTEIFNEVCELADLVLIDLKIANSGKHKAYTDTENVLIHTNLKHLTDHSIPFRVRIPLVNELTADDENLINIAELLKDGKEINIDLLSYHDLGKEKWQKSGLMPTHRTLSAPDKKRLAEIKALFKSYGYNVNIGG